MMKKIVLLLTIPVFMSCGDLSKKMPLVEIDKKLKSGNLEEAEHEINEFLEKNERNEFAWTLKGHISADLDKDSMAIGAYEHALELDPFTVEAITGLGIIERKRKNYQKASELYYRAIQIDPDYAQAYSSLVTIHLKQIEFEKAVDAGLKGYNLDKADPVITANLAIAYHYFGDTLNREKYYHVSERNGYQSLETLRQIFSGELTILD